jgi:hypothetical protein
VGFRRESHINTQLLVVIGTYKFIQVSTVEVSTTGSFEGSLSSLRDGINKSEISSGMEHPISYLGKKE